MAPRPGLNKAIIVQTAGELADQIGLRNLTFATVAEHLSVRTPSLYNHVEGLDGLRRELCLFAIYELDKRLQRAALGKSEDDAIYSMLLAYRAFVKERPGVYESIMSAPEWNDSQIQSASEAVIDTVLTVLEPYHLNHDDALHVIRGFRTIGHGFATLEVTGAFKMCLETDESYQRLISMFLRGMVSPEKMEI